MPQADGRNLGGRKITYYYVNDGTKITANIRKLIEGTVASGDKAAALTAAKALVVDDNLLKGSVDDVSEFGSVTESVTETPYGAAAFNVAGAGSLSDPDITLMPDHSNAKDLAFIQDADGKAVLFIEQIQGNTAANKTFNFVVGTTGGVVRIANKNGAQRYRRAIHASGILLAQT